MNIYITSDNPVEAAHQLDDTRLIQTCLNTAKILSTALWRNNVWDSSLYRPDMNHKDNPCVVWAARSRNNFVWLVKYGLESCAEYKYRWDRPTVHGASVIIKNCRDILKKSPHAFQETVMTPFANNTPYKSEYDAVEAYHRFMNENEWVFDTVAPTWTKRGEPWFYRAELRKVV